MTANDNPTVAEVWRYNHQNLIWSALEEEGGELGHQNSERGGQWIGDMMIFREGYLRVGKNWAYFE